MNNQTIQLSAEELALIEARRAEEQARVERIAAEQAIREEKARIAKAKADAKRNGLREALFEADTTNLLYDTGDGVIRFVVGGREEQVRIEEHTVYPSGSWRGESRGLKYTLSCSFNGYSHRTYKNPTTVLKKIQEAQSAAIREAEKVKARANLKERALDLAEETYPNAVVTFERGYEGYSRSSGKPNRVVVTTDKGSYEFTYVDLGEEGIRFDVYSRKINKEIDEEVRKMILG